MTDINIYLLGLIAAVSTAVTAWATTWANNRKFSTACAEVQEAYIKLSNQVSAMEDRRAERTIKLEDMQARLTEATRRITELEAASVVDTKLIQQMQGALATLNDSVDQLTQQLLDNGITPVVRPRKGKTGKLG